MLRTSWQKNTASTRSGRWLSSRLVLSPLLSPARCSRTAVGWSVTWAGRFAATASTAGVSAVATFNLDNHASTTTLQKASPRDLEATVGTRYRSTLHRVVPPLRSTQGRVRRRSFAFFHDGNADAVITTLPGCSGPEEPELYAPTTVAEHIAAKLAGSRAGRINRDAPREAARVLAARPAG